MAEDRGDETIAFHLDLDLILEPYLFEERHPLRVADTYQARFHVMTFYGSSCPT
jgi:hypothetical protein